MFSELFRRSPAAKSPLKVGLLLDGLILPQCFVDVLEDIRESNFAVIDSVFIQRLPEPRILSQSRRLRRWIARVTDRNLRAHLLYDLYVRWDTRRRRAGSALSEVDCTTHLRDVERIYVQPITRGFVHRFPEDALEAIKRRDLDVLLRFGFNILRGDILTAARYGVWSFHHGDNVLYRGGPALFWELWEENPLSGVVLQRLTEELDAGIVLCKSIFATAESSSLEESRQGPYIASTHFVIRKLYELHRFGYAEVEARRVAEASYQGRRRLYRTPTNSEMLQWISRRLAARTRRMCDAPMAKNWKVGIRKGGPFLDDAVADATPVVLSGFRWIESATGKYYADPFLIKSAGRTWLFVEEFDYSDQKGRIAVAGVADDGSPLEFSPCLDLPHHLSFPFVFHDQNDIWMIPESANSHEVTLYRASRFPFEWVAERVLLRGDYVDTVVWKDEGAWWMLTTVREPPGYSVHTLLFTAHALDGEWSLHPASPLFNDVRLARNGGAVIKRSERRFRVSQDCSVEYGRAFQFQEITALTDTTYSERTVARIEPDFLPDMIATHTYNRVGDLEVIDGCFLERSRRISASSNG